jgi:hypothetical protein
MKIRPQLITRLSLVAAHSLVFSGVAVFANPSVGGGDADCPPGYVLGDKDAPNVILFRQADGERAVRFDEVVLLRRSEGFLIQLPDFKHNQWDIIPVDSFDGEAPADAAEQVVQLTGQSSLSGCLAVPAEIQSADFGDAPVGKLVFRGGVPTADSETFEASFEFVAKADPKIAIIGEIKKGRVVHAMPSAPKEKGEMQDPLNGGMADVDTVLVSHFPDLERLTVEMSYKIPGGGGSTEFHIMNFKGVAGIYTNEDRAFVDGDFTDIVRVALVDRFENGQVDLEVRTLTPAQLPKGELAADALRKLGSLNAKLKNVDVLGQSVRPLIR